MATKGSHIDFMFFAPSLTQLLDMPLYIRFKAPFTVH